MFEVDIFFNCGFPKVTVPVLSNMNISILFRFSNAEVSLKIIPDAVAFAEPIMMAIGVASPNAHGQAIIKTETVVKIAFSYFGSLGSRIHAKPTMIEINMIAGTNKLETLSTNFWIGIFDCCTFVNCSIISANKLFLLDLVTL